MSSFTLQLTHNTALPRRLFEANDYTNNYITTHNSLKKIHKKNTEYIKNTKHSITQAELKQQENAIN